MQLTETAVITALESSGHGFLIGQVVQIVGSSGGGYGLVSSQGQYERVGGAFGGAPGFFRRVADVTVFKALNGLSVDIPSIGEEFVHTILY